MRRCAAPLKLYWRMTNKQKILSNAQPWSLLRANFLPTLLLLKWLLRRHAGTYELQALLSKGEMGEVPLAPNTRFS